jgi:hypothetical protein
MLLAVLPHAMVAVAIRECHLAKTSPLAVFVLAIIVMGFFRFALIFFLCMKTKVSEIETDKL